MKKTVLAILILSLSVFGMMLTGCEDDDSQEGDVIFNDPSEMPDHNVSTDNASFIGIDVCKVCHAEIASDYAMTSHGQNFRFHERGDLIDGFSGRCQPCHTVGYDEPSGFNDFGTNNPDLEGIQCEECHGPGSRHGGNPMFINRVPDARDTCWDCHASDYKLWRKGFTPVTDDDLEDDAPGDIGVHHPQSLPIGGSLLAGYHYEGSSYESASHTKISNSCVTCHFFTQAHEGHTQESLHPDIESCRFCHLKANDLESLIAATQSEFTALLIRLGGQDPANPGHPSEDADGGLLQAWAEANDIDLENNSDPTDDAVRRYKGARYNYFLVLADASFGVHNGKYMRQLLLDSIASLHMSE